MRARMGTSEMHIFSCVAIHVLTNFSPRNNAGWLRLVRCNLCWMVHQARCGAIHLAAHTVAWTRPMPVTYVEQAILQIRLLGS